MESDEPEVREDRSTPLFVIDPHASAEAEEFQDTVIGMLGGIALTLALLTLAVSLMFWSQRGD